MHAIDASPLIYGRRPEQIGTGPSPALSKGDVMDRLVALMSASIALSVVQLVSPANGRAAEVEDNVRTMMQAARSLKFNSPVDAPANKAYMLEKQGEIRSQVAVIFGYEDNASACEQIAKMLTESRVAEFQCQPVY
jgi:tRNA C32,U32 (ribose-2'-O)-methylase TrmJ